ncbi:hypothetical protein CW304_20700 [Bacillus sp. UFRGS-B20]|nr:hypothetical protein CW304_20700 [Bacillus sp. UFRGS-B20]
MEISIYAEQTQCCDFLHINFSILYFLLHSSGYPSLIVKGLSAIFFPSCRFSSQLGFSHRTVISDF